MVGAILDRNYEILEELVKSGIKAIWVADAIAIGYNPAYVTSYRKHGTRSMCHCYDICYVATENRMTSIKKFKIFPYLCRPPTMMTDLSGIKRRRARYCII